MKSYDYYFLTGAVLCSFDHIGMGMLLIFMAVTEGLLKVRAQ